MSEQWVPHQRETWPFIFATVKRDVEAHEYQGYWNSGSPVMKTHIIYKGTVVRIVMVSRFGDVGITDDLDKQYGYEARISFDDIEEVTL